MITSTTGGTVSTAPTGSTTPLEMTAIEKGLYDAELVDSQAHDGKCMSCLLGGYVYCAEDGDEAGGKCLPAFCEEADPLTAF